MPSISKDKHGNVIAKDDPEGIFNLMDSKPKWFYIRYGRDTDKWDYLPFAKIGSIVITNLTFLSWVSVSFQLFGWNHTWVFKY